MYPRAVRPRDTVAGPRTGGEGGGALLEGYTQREGTVDRPHRRASFLAEGGRTVCKNFHKEMYNLHTCIMCKINSHPAVGAEGNIENLFALGTCVCLYIQEKFVRPSSVRVFGSRCLRSGFVNNFI